MTVANMIIVNGRGFRLLPTIAVDSKDNVHVAFAAQFERSDQVFYVMLNGNTGATFIDATVVSPADRFRAAVPAIMVGPRDEIAIVFQDRNVITRSEVYMTRLDPARDDQDGDAADVSQIVVLTETLLTPDDRIESIHPAATLDAQGNVRLTRLENDSRPGTELFFQVFDLEGTAIRPAAAVTTGSTATTTTDFTRAFLAVDGQTSYVTWTDNASGQAEVLLQTIQPDNDRDGLTNAQEQILGWDPNNADSDGDTVLDGDEDTDSDGLTDSAEFVHGLDPMDGSDALADFDSDGLTNAAEIGLGTKINVSDSDKDGLTDGQEVNTFGTDPLNDDTDGGGRTDGNEVLIDGTDPLDAADDLAPP